MLLAAGAIGVAPAPAAPRAPAPEVATVAISPVETPYACAAGEPVLERDDRAGLEVVVRVSTTSGRRGAQVQAALDRSRPAGWVGQGAPIRLWAAPGATVWVRARDAAGARSRWVPEPAPAPETVLASPELVPFTASLLCPAPPRAARLLAVNRAWRGAGGRAVNRQRLRPPGSALVWTAYSGQGIHPNWVHAGTELNQRLRHGSPADFRAGVSELVSWSTLDRAPDGSAFRVNESTFTAPDDGHRPPWRDGMGSAVALALLAPALPPGADAAEIGLARRTAGEYLRTFSVDWRAGGVLWRDGGAGAWYLEYAYRSRSRILNGFMQAVVSLARFEREAARLGVRDQAWRGLAHRARERVSAGAQAVDRWLPAYDLGGGRTRYSLLSGAAREEYRVYHTELLAQLERIAYLPERWRATFARYRRAWGG